MSAPFRDNTPIWKGEDFPCRVKVAGITLLTPETAIPVFELRDRLSAFQGLTNPIAWTGRFRGSPARWSASDGDAVLDAVRDATENPVIRPVDPAKLARRPRAFKTRLGLVTVPEREEQDGAVDPAPIDQPNEAKEPTVHTEIQWLLLKLGSDMGHDVWVARNDRNREWRDHRFADIPRLRGDLPRLFDEVTQRTVELIDVLWLRGHTIVGAFEIESTTSIYSGLLRMSDLIAMLPNLTIPLYLVAPDDRRHKVLAEVTRATFRRLKPPLEDVCQYLSFSSLREAIRAAGSLVPFLSPDFIGRYAEPCVADEA